MSLEEEEKRHRDRQSQRGEHGMKTQTHREGSRPCGDEGRDWREAGKSQGAPGFAGSHEKLEREHSPVDTSISEC